MPKIPTYDSPEGSPAGVPNVGIRVDSRGAFGEADVQPLEALNQAGDKVLGSAMAVYSAEKRKAVDADATQGHTKFIEAATELGHNPDYGLFNRRGEDAINASEDYYAALKLKQQQVSDSLSSDEAKRIFNQRSSEFMAANHLELEKFVSSQRQQVYDDTFTLNATAGLNAIRQDYGNDAVAATHYKTMATAAVQLAASDEAKATKLNQLKSMVTATRIKAALDQQSPDWQTAQRIYDSSGDTLGEGQEEVRKRITEARTKVTADSLAQQYVGANLDETGRPIDGAIQAEVDKLDPGEFREKVQQQVQERIARTSASYKQAEEDRLGRVILGVERSGGTINESSDDYAMLSPANKAKAWERRNTMLRQDKSEQSGVDREELKRFSALEREQQATVNINTQFPGASQTARYQMIAQQNAVKSQLLKGQGEPLNEFDAQIKGVSTQLNFQKDVAADLKAQMDTWYLEQQRTNNGKPPTRDEVNRELSARLQQSKGGFLGMGKRFRFQVPEGEDFEARPAAEQPYGAVVNRASTSAVGPGTQAGSGGRSSAPAKTLPAGVKLGKDGKAYQKTAAGKWAPYNG
jgi:hypothetical protein